MATRTCRAPADRERVLLACVPQVTARAAWVASRVPQQISRDELVSAGMLGLLEAWATYDARRDVPFRTYAARRIHGAMRDELRGLDWAPRRVREKARALATATEAVERCLGRPAQGEEIAAALGVSLATYDAWRCQAHRMVLLRLDAPAQSTEEDVPTTLGEALLADPAQDPEALLARRQRQTHLRAAVAALPPIVQQVLTHYYAEGDTMQQIGTRLGRTEGRISQLHAQALRQLRGLLSDSMS